IGRARSQIWMRRHRATTGHSARVDMTHSKSAEIFRPIGPIEAIGTKNKRSFRPTEGAPCVLQLRLMHGNACGGRTYWHFWEYWQPQKMKYCNLQKITGCCSRVD